MSDVLIGNKLDPLDLHFLVGPQIKNPATNLDYPVLNLNNVKNDIYMKKQ